MTSPITHVAQAIEDAIRAGRSMEDAARAAVEAIRVPTIGMMLAAAKVGEFSAVHNYGSPATDEAIWDAMIDELLRKVPHG